MKKETHRVIRFEYTTLDKIIFAGAIPVLIACYVITLMIGFNAI